MGRMDEFIDSLGDDTVFSTLDKNHVYCKLEVVRVEREKTTFSSHDGLFRFTRRPCGVKKALGTFKRAIDIIVHAKRWYYALVY